VLICKANIIINVTDWGQFIENIVTDWGQFIENIVTDWGVG
jgi:hypothetical protein